MPYPLYHLKSRERPALLDRRHNHLLRARFDSAHRLLEHPPDTEKGANTTLFRVLNRLQQIHPDAPPEDIEAVVRAVLRAHQSRAAARGAKHVEVARLLTGARSED